MVNVNARKRLANVIEGYLDGAISNFDLDDALSVEDMDDAICRAIKSEMWFLYDDIISHRNSGEWRLSDATERAVRRWLVLLRTSDDSLSTEHSNKNGIVAKLVDRILPSPRWRENIFWPWEDEEHWLVWLKGYDLT